MSPISITSFSAIDLMQKIIPMYLPAHSPQLVELLDIGLFLP